MLDSSKQQWSEASPEEKDAAEMVAHRFLIDELEQNLVPYDEAKRIVDARMAEGDETWCRTRYGILISLRHAQFKLAPVAHVTNQDTK